MSKAIFRLLVEHVRGAFAVLGALEPPSTAVVLYALAGCDNEPTVSELAEAAGVTLKTASRTLKMLRKQGWVALKEDPQDSRMKRVTLTHAGESATAIIAPSFVQIARRVVALADRERHGPLPAARERHGHLSTPTKALAAALVTLHISAGLMLGSFVQQVLGDDGLITTTEASSNGYLIGAV